jgi:hypothetical protein
MEIWTCKRYSREYPKLCVEAGKVRVIPISEHKKIVESIIKRKEDECQKRCTQTKKTNY